MSYKSQQLFLIKKIVEFCRVFTYSYRICINRGRLERWWCFMTNKIPEDVIENIRKANDIVDVVGEYVQLNKQGRNYFGRCPFHDENTPSFSVTQEKQIFYCFGCKKGGNVITFLMELEGYSFYEAVHMLAEKSNISMPDVASKQKQGLSSENQSILSAYEWLGKLYHHLLRYTEDGKAGYEYLQQRDIYEQSFETFQLGYAPNTPNFVPDFLEEKGFHQQLLIKAGLLKLQSDHNVVDPFRGRVIYPIRNHLGKIVAFGGRAITDQGPKYLNSPEHPLFQKSKLLFNFDLAKRHIRKEREVILFEGQMDVISAYQVGVRNVIATLGTALTDYQAKLLKRYVDTVIICYDADRAGIEASYKAANLLKRAGCAVKIADLKDGLDPDGYIRAYGVTAFEDQVIKSSDTYMSFYMRYIQKDFNLSLESDQLAYIQEIIKKLAMIESSVEREYYLKELKERFNVSIDSLKEEIHAYQKNSSFRKDKSEQNSYTKKTIHIQRQNKLRPAYVNAERVLIAYMLQDPLITDRVQKEIGVDFNLEEHKVIVTHLYGYYEAYDTMDISVFIDWLKDEQLTELAIELSMMDVADRISDQEINDYMHTIKRQKEYVETVREYKQQQKLAEQQNDPIKAAEIAMEIIAIKKQLENTL